MKWFWALALLLFLFRVASAAEIQVSDPSDVWNTTDGKCTLREAIIRANGPTGPAPWPLPPGECVFGDDNGQDTIVLPANLYKLIIATTHENKAANGDLDITEDLIIRGAGAETTIIDGGGIDRVFHIIGTTKVEISGVTIQNGKVGLDTTQNPPVVESGGGLWNINSTVTLKDCILSGNRAILGGGIQNDSGTVEIINCTIKGNFADNEGGGIRNGGTVNISFSTISGNEAVNPGGGIENFGTANLTNSTISANRCGATGGGISNEAGDLNLYIVTVTDNTAAKEGSPMGHGGGISNGSGKVRIVNSIVAGNHDSNGAIDCFGLIDSGTYNLISNNNQCSFANGTGDQVGTAANPIDPKLGPLQNNGGPTFTHALLAGSPAIDAGNPSGCKDKDGALLQNDQRLTARVVDGDSDGKSFCDLGAYEAPMGTKTTASTMTAENQAPGGCSLRK